MNKRGRVGFIMFVVVLFLFAAAIIVSTNIEHKGFQDFCEDNGFDSYERGAWRGIDHVCIKVEDGYRVEKKFDKCGKVYCFIRTTSLADFTCYRDGGYYPDYYCEEMNDTFRTGRDALVSGDEQ